jgi:putative copper resistance protein D
MLEVAVVVLRFVQYAAAAILLGTPLVVLLARRSDAPGARAMAAGAAVVLALATLVALVAQTGLLAGSLAAGFAPENLLAVVLAMNFGKAAVIRALAAAAAAAVLLARWDRPGPWRPATAFAALAAASFAWMGHAGAAEGATGALHLLADVLHSLAGALWVGALAAFLLLTARADETAAESLHLALRRFSMIGTALVAALAATGLVNGFFLVGFDVQALWTTPYGRLLGLKVALFAAMVGLAALNRFQLTPALGRALLPEERTTAVAALRRSIAVEGLFGLSVLALVAWFGTLPPPAH